jgi:hypothetical protein
LGGKPVELFQRDIHRAKGVTCAGCHGGNSKVDDMEKAMDKGAEEELAGAIAAFKKSFA